MDIRVSIMGGTYYDDLGNKFGSLGETLDFAESTGPLPGARTVRLRCRSSLTSARACVVRMQKFRVILQYRLAEFHSNSSSEKWWHLLELLERTVVTIQEDTNRVPDLLSLLTNGADKMPSIYGM